MRALPKEGFSYTPIQYAADLRDTSRGTWTARQWSGNTKKGEWRGTVHAASAMEGTLVVTRSEGTIRTYTFHGSPAATK